MVKKLYTTITNKLAQLDDNQLVKMVQDGKYDALAELWTRHADIIKKITLAQHYKIQPDFSENRYNSEYLWNNRMGISYLNLEKAAKDYDFARKTPFLAFFAMKNKYALLDEKELNTELSNKHFHCDNYDCFENREDRAAENMQDIMQSIEKCLGDNKALLAFFQKYASIINNRGHINQSKMAILMRTTRQTINTNFKKIRSIAKECGLEKDFLAMLSAQDSAPCYAEDTYLDSAA